MAVGPANAGPVSPPGWHVTFHLQTPRLGFPIELERDVTGAELIAWLKATEENLEKAGFKPAVTIAAVSTPAGDVADDESWLPAECPNCGAKRETFYDNRNDPKRPPNGPLLKCRACDKGFWKDPPRGAKGSRR